MKSWLNILFFIFTINSLVYATPSGGKTLFKESKALKKAGWKLYHKGDYTSAKEKFQLYILKKEQHFGKNNSSIAATYSNTGNVYKKMKDYKTAVMYYQKSIDIYENLSNKKKLGASAPYENLSALYLELKDYEKALFYKEKSLALTKLDKKNRHLIPHTYNAIASIYTNMGIYSKALEYYQKSLSIFKSFGSPSQLAQTYNQIGDLYYRMENFQKTSEYYEKASVILEKSLEDKNRGKRNFLVAFEYARMSDFYIEIGNLEYALKYRKKGLEIYKKYGDKKGVFIPTSYNNIASIYSRMGEYKHSLEYLKKALIIQERESGKTNPETVRLYSNIANLYRVLGNYQKSLIYHKKALKGCEEGCGKHHPNTTSIYDDLSVLNMYMKNYSEAHSYAQLTFNNLLVNIDQLFSIIDSKAKERYLKSTFDYVSFLLGTSLVYINQLKKESNVKKSQEVLNSGANAWLNYKGSIFDSENTIAMLYGSTKDKKLKAKIDDLVSSKRYLANLYQSLPKPKERESWQKSIKNTEEKIAKVTNEIASKASSFKEQQGLQSINYKDITSKLGVYELYIDYAKAGGYYYLFTFDQQENIEFIQMDKNSTKKIDSLIKTFREDITAILNSKDLTDEKLKELAVRSKEKLSELYDLVIKKPFGETVKDKKSLIISPDGALRLLPFEALFNKEHNKYFIEEKEIRYIPSGKELVRLYKYSKDKVSKTQKSTVIFANPNFDTKISTASKDEITITPNTSRSGIIKSLFRMRFAALPGTKAEAKAIKATLNQKHILEYQDTKATESTLVKVKGPKILHIATHGFFINDDTIPNPMLKSGIALAGANNSAIKGKSDGIVTALKLSGLDLKGTDLVVLSACQTGVVDINSTDSVSGLSKAFIQAGAKDIVMSLWSVDDQATKELMTSFYQEMKENKNYAEALKAAKLKMIEEGRHPFYWAAFVVSGL